MGGGQADHAGERWRRSIAMPSIEHESVVEIIRQRPEIAARFLRDQLDVQLPPYQQVRLEAADLNDLTPTEYRADAVVTLRDASGDTPALGIVIEVRLNRDGDKWWSWPAYVVTLRARLRCPTMLLVICPDAAEARKCATPIELGHPGFVLHPLVLGPDRVPVVTDLDQVRGAPELAVLSAIALSSHPDYLKILDTLAAALATTDRDRAVQYAEIMLAVLPDGRRQYWEVLMTAQTFEFQSDYARRLRAEGEARLVLAVLEARGIEVPDSVRARITGCSDPDLLEAWGRRAATIRTIDELFD
jgi:hypothetical protein